jgi:RNA polymerase sigma-70 factor (ECF subfamily)
LRAVRPTLREREQAELHRQVRELVHEYADFVWRSLRRLGVAPAECDDGCQRVWMVVAQNAASILPGKERSYVFSVLVRVAAEMRRSQKRREYVELEESMLLAADLESELQQQQCRQVLDKLLSGLSWELRTVFVLFELEAMSSVEIAEVLGVSRGTVASRLRLARAQFQRELVRYQARAQSLTHKFTLLAEKSGVRWFT